MPKNRIDFSRDQLNFLAVFEVMKIPISLDIANAVAPLIPSSLLDLLKKTKGGILQKMKVICMPFRRASGRHLKHPVTAQHKRAGVFYSGSAQPAEPDGSDFC